MAPARRRGLAFHCRRLRDYVKFVEEVLGRSERVDQDSPAGLLMHTLVGASRPDDVSAALFGLHHLGVVEVSGSYLVGQGDQAPATHEARRDDTARLVARILR